MSNVRMIETDRADERRSKKKKAVGRRPNRAWRLLSFLVALKSQFWMRVWERSVSVGLSCVNAAGTRALSRRPDKAIQKKLAGARSLLKSHFSPKKKATAGDGSMESRKRTVRCRICLQLCIAFAHHTSITIPSHRLHTA